MTIRVQLEDFDVGAELSGLTDGNHGVGGLCSFVGLVRDMAGSEPISAMTLEHYPGMTERAIAGIAAEAERRFSLLGCTVLHRVGTLRVGEGIVLVLAAAPHRGDALDATAFLIDWLKTKAPFWKLEDTPDGGKWVDARDSDDAAAQRWRDAPPAKPRAAE